jgi:hypothetical protein
VTAVVALAWTAGGTVALVLAARYVNRIGHELFGPHDLDWPTGLALANLVLPIVAGLAGVLTVVAYAYALATGGLPAWTLAGVALLAGYGAHRVRLWVARLRAEREDAR